MNLTDASLQRVDTHWAVLAVGEAERDRALAVCGARLVKRAVGNQIRIEFPEHGRDEDLLSRLAMAYEIAAIEGINAFLSLDAEKAALREQCAAGAWRAFEIGRLFDLPRNEHDRILHVLHLSALAYCGDRWSDLRRWYNENPQAAQVAQDGGAGWHHRLLYRLFNCWIRLIRKSSWEDLDQIAEIIAGLRAEQSSYEARALDSGSNAADRAMALRLICLYHWAKGTELLATYMLQGEPGGIAALLDKHFEAAIDAAALGADAELEMLMRWLHLTARQMVGGSLWWVARAVNSRVSRFVHEVTKHQAMFELLPPQRAALQEQGLLDQAATAIVVDMPTSGGKTLLAQFRILQALNQFDRDKGWVAYVAPTRALSAQITRRLRRDFAPIGIRVEQLTGAVEIDAFEEDLLTSTGDGSVFDVLVSTPEKLQLVIRNRKVPRPLALVVMDEAHNIADETRGLRIELLLATIKRECTTANFLLLMPYVEKAETLARWLAQDVNAGRAISFSTTPWMPNERIVGTYCAAKDTAVRGGWHMAFQTLTTTPRAVHLDGTHQVGGVKPLDVPRSKLTLSLQTAAMATVLSDRGTSIAVANSIDSVWTMARHVDAVLQPLSPMPDEIRLVQDFLRTEISPDFELVGLLGKGVGVHHAGLSDEARALIEWLAEEGKLKVLCATSTVAQGINFPVSSVFLASRYLPQGHRAREMYPREFWNLAGRAGRMNHDSVGVVGLAADERSQAQVAEFVSRATGQLVSRLVNLLSELEQAGRLHQLETVIQGEQWEDFRCYVAHLWNEKQSLDAVLADTEQLLRNTFGYGILRTEPNGRAKADRLLEATRNYVRRLAQSPGAVALADTTGFSPEGVGKALAGLSQLEQKLTVADWSPEGLFGQGSHMAALFGVMLRVPQLAESLRDLGGEGPGDRHLAEITKAWVEGRGIQDIAREFFQADQDQTRAITEACKAIYRSLANAGTWGISALSRLSGLDMDQLPEADRRRINSLPAMVYHGVKTEDAVLMRMNSVPRSIAESMGDQYRSWAGERQGDSELQQARRFLRELGSDGWDRVCPKGSHLSGAEFKRVWELLSGEKR
ncbi:MAG TPA: DEAD/DEAH box helicase [Armatimonadota bacterium]|nr:DEAD/DEAH box helicase [Armatimonadota bacterium]